jgi:hypothetical protein
MQSLVLNTSQTSPCELAAPQAPASALTDGGRSGFLRWGCCWRAAQPGDISALEGAS